ncbi:MAG: hypothetical protein ACRD59_10975 [Candidatus Acidiferrales bacterium]
MKITPYAESGCPVNGQTCDCAADEHPYAIHEEAKHAGTADTLRFLAAGARRALWLETKENRLSDALPALQAKIANAKHVIIESDAIMKFWKPSLFLIVLDPGNPDFKSSARENLSLADGFVYRSPFAPAGLGIAVAQKPQFLQTFGSPLPLELRQFLSGSIS